MADRIRDGEDPSAVLRAGAGVDSLSADERTALIAASDDAHDAVATIVSARAGVAWTTGGHTAVDVGVYAYGPGADVFAGSRTAAAVGRLLFEALGLSDPEPRR
jgi:alkaline phosphatase